MSRDSIVLIINFLTLLFGTQGRPGRKKPFSTNKKRETLRGFCTQEGPTGSCLVSIPFFFDTPQS